MAAAFNQAALESFGGGLSAWSREVIVRERGWLTDQQFADSFAITRVTPGPSTLLDYRADGIAGALAATGVMLSSGRSASVLHNQPDLGASGNGTTVKGIRNSPNSPRRTNPSPAGC